MLGKSRTQALVVGAGPVGLMTAFTLAEQGVDVRILDREERTGRHSYALALHPASLALLDQFGLAEFVLARARRLKEVVLMDANGERARAKIPETHGRLSEVVVLRQADFEQMLENELRERHSVDVEWCHSAILMGQEDDHARMRVDTRAKDSLGYAVQRAGWTVTSQKHVDVPFVIACDGMHSPLRGALEIDYEELEPPVDFAVFEFETEAQLDDALYLVFDDGKANVCWPMPENRCRWSFQVPVREEGLEPRHKERYFGEIGGHRYPLLETGELDRMLSERAPWFGSKHEDPRWSMQVRFEKRLASSFGRGRVFLAGDSAHMTGPAGIQSMNVGLLEGAELGEHIGRVISGDEGLDHVHAWAAEWRGRWQQLLGMGQKPQVGSDTDPWIAEYRDALLSCLPASGENLEQMLASFGLSWSATSKR